MHGIFRNKLLFHSDSFQQENEKNKSFALLMVSKCFGSFSLLGTRAKSKVSSAELLLVIICLLRFYTAANSPGHTELYLNLFLSLSG